MKSLFLILTLCLSIICFVNTADSVLMSADPDDFSEGTNLRDAFNGISVLWEWYDGDTDTWFEPSHVSSINSPYASTGSLVFSPDLPNGEIMRFSIYFDNPTNYFSADLIGVEGEYSPLIAVSSINGGDWDSTIYVGWGEVKKFEISSPTNTIESIHFGQDESVILLDNLHYNVPEPSTILLISCGLSGVVFFGRKSRKKQVAGT